MRRLQGSIRIAAVEHPNIDILIPLRAAGLSSAIIPPIWAAAVISGGIHLLPLNTAFSVGVELGLGLTADIPKSLGSCCAANLLILISVILRAAASIDVDMVHWAAEAVPDVSLS